MKAAQISKYGDSSVIQVNEVEKPSVDAGRILVEVHAASLNPFDTIVRAGFLKEMIPLTLPATLGGDLAGIVAEVGEGVSDLGVGEKVYGQANVVAGDSGALAEIAATSGDHVAKMPENLDFNEAASLVLVGVSALQAITEHIKLRTGQKVFINGGSGGIGRIAIQIAHHLGAYVAATATGDALAYVKSLGADRVIDYKSQDFTTILNDYDGLLDTGGGEDFIKSLSILKHGGVAVSMKGQADAEKAKDAGVEAISQQTHVTKAALDELSKLVLSGIVTPHIGKVFPLSDIAAAFVARENGLVKGKIVVETN